MSYFTKPLTENVTIPREPSDPLMDPRLLEIEKANRLAENEFNDACFQVAQWRARHNRTFVLNGKLYKPAFNEPLDPQLRMLEHRKSETQEKRNGLLAQRADLRKTLGICR